MQGHSKFAHAVLEDFEEAFPSDADEPVPAGGHRFSTEMDIDIVPTGELLVDHFRRDGIVARDVVDRDVGENDTPAEGDARRIPLEQLDLVRRIAQFHRDREIEASGTGSDACDLHG